MKTKTSLLKTASALMLALLMLAGCSAKQEPEVTTAAAETTVLIEETTLPEEDEKLNIDLKTYALVSDSVGKQAVFAALNLFKNKVDTARAYAGSAAGAPIERTNKLHFGLRTRDDERAAGLAFRDFRIMVAEDGGIDVSAVSIYGLVYAAQYIAELTGTDGVLLLESDSITSVYEYENTDAGRKLADYENASGRMLVMSHRGDFVNYPENSVAAFSSCADAGVDIVEMDVVKTASGSYMLMHDKTVNRTTTGTGTISELTDSYLRSLRLKSGSGGNSATITSSRIPFFDEVLDACKDRILINLDKFDSSCRADVYAMLAAKGMLDYAVFKGSDSISSLDSYFASFISSGKQLPTFSTMIYSSDLSAAKSTLESYYGYTAMAELGVSGFNMSAQKELCKFSTSLGIRPMVLTISSSYNGIGSDSENLWHTLETRGFTVFMTNTPLDMVKFYNK